MTVVVMGWGGSAWCGSRQRSGQYHDQPEDTLCTDTHLRLYAPSPGYLKNPVLGRYVIATAHLDRRPCSKTPRPAGKAVTHFDNDGDPT
jgi:hypothetical protein